MKMTKSQERALARVRSHFERQDTAHTIHEIEVSAIGGDSKTLSVVVTETAREPGTALSTALLLSAYSHRHFFIGSHGGFTAYGVGGRQVSGFYESISATPKDVLARREARKASSTQ